MKQTNRVKESAVLRECAALIKAYGLSIWRNNSGAVQTANGGFFRAGYAGSSDFIGFCNKTGRFIAIECKRPQGGRLSEKQKLFLQNVKTAGGVAAVVTSAAELYTALVSAGVLK